MVKLDACPFFLDEARQRWVRETLNSLSTEEKIGQIFCETIWNCSPEEEEIAFSGIQPGGIMFRGGSREVIYRFSGSHVCSQSLHLSCKKCGKTVHMQQQLADALVESVAANDDFSIDKGETVIYGVCSACKNS